MNTIRDLCAAALRKIGVLGAGETMSASNADAALMALQVMVDDMANENLLIPVTTVLSISMAAGSTSYTVGTYPAPVPDPLPDNHIETAKPTAYLSAYVRDSANNDFAVSIIPENQYSQISTKLLTSRPTCVYVQDGWPLDTLQFDAAGYDTSDTFKLVCLLPLSGYLTTSSLNDTIDMPPGYKRMVLYNLCIDLAPEWEKKISREIATVAAQSKRNLKGKNLVVGKLRSDAPGSVYGGPGFYNIHGGPVE